MLSRENAVIYSKQHSYDLYQILISRKCMAIEAVIEPCAKSKPNLSYILAYGAVEEPCNNFALAQRRDNLVFFLRTTEPPPGSIVHITEVRNVFAESSRKNIVIIRDEQTIKILVDGLLLKDTEIPGTFLNWHPEARIFVANDASGKGSWEGVLHRIAVYDCALVSQDSFSQKMNLERERSLLYYDFDKTGIGNIIPDYGSSNVKMDLLVPEHFTVLGKTVLSLPDHYSLFSSGFLKDALINLFGFIPFGFIVFLREILLDRTERRAFWASIILALAVSLLIEIMQIFLPLRTSSSVDLLNNTLGSFIGAYVCMKCIRLKGVNEYSRQN